MKTNYFALLFIVIFHIFFTLQCLNGSVAVVNADNDIYEFSKIPVANPTITPDRKYIIQPNKNGGFSLELLDATTGELTQYLVTEECGLDKINHFLTTIKSLQEDISSHTGSLEEKKQLQSQLEKTHYEYTKIKSRINYSYDQTKKKIVAIARPEKIIVSPDSSIIIAISSHIPPLNPTFDFWEDAQNNKILLCVWRKKRENYYYEHVAESLSADEITSIDIPFSGSQPSNIFFDTSSGRQHMLTLENGTFKEIRNTTYKPIRHTKKGSCN